MYVSPITLVSIPNDMSPRPGARCGHRVPPPRTRRGELCRTSASGRSHPTHRPMIPPRGGLGSTRRRFTMHDEVARSAARESHRGSAGTSRSSIALGHSCGRAATLLAGERGIRSAYAAGGTLRSPQRRPVCLYGPGKRAWACCCSVHRGYIVARVPGAPYGGNSRVASLAHTHDPA